jgi:hypothetical protein
VIHALFAEADKFHNGLAPVSNNYVKGLIDKTGTFVASEPNV